MTQSNRTLIRLGKKVFYEHKFLYILRLNKYPSQYTGVHIYYKPNCF